MPRKSDPPRITTIVGDTPGWGVVLAIVAAAISGLAIWLNAFAVKQIPDPTVYTALKNGVAVVVLLAAAVPFVRPADVRAVRRVDWLVLTVVGLVGGGAAFILFFSGLAAASGPAAAFIQKTLFVWVAILAVPLLGERLGALQVGALGVLIVGQAVILPPRGIAWGTGETLIVLATLCWAAEVVVVRRLLRGVAAPIVALGRLGVGLIAIVAFLGATGRIAGLGAVSPAGAAWVMVTGVILAAYVSTWFAALRRAPATVVTSILVGGALITGVLQAVAKGGAPTIDVVAGYALIAGAVGLTAILGARSGRAVRPTAVTPVPVTVDA